MEGPGGGGGKLSSEGAGLLASPANDMQEQVEGGVSLREEGGWTSARKRKSELQPAGGGGEQAGQAEEIGAAPPN